MTNCIYDGSFEGLMTLVFDVYKNKIEPENIYIDGKVQMNMISKNVNIYTNSKKAERVYNGIREKISSRALKNIYQCYLSEIDGIEMYIFKYIKLGFKVGRKVDNYEFDDTVNKVHEISRKVGAEAHRMLGLLRFIKISDNLYYSKIEPDYNIIGLISPHFCNRMKDQGWIIHDIKRKIASVYNKKDWIITDFNEKLTNIDNDEIDFQELWKEYYKSIGIKERRNDKLKKQYMPVRYWKNLTELDSIIKN